MRLGQGVDSKVPPGWFSAVIDRLAKIIEIALGILAVVRPCGKRAQERTTAVREIACGSIP